MLKTERSEDDKILVKQALKGSQRAQTALYNKYYDHIRKFIINIVKDTNDAEDITLEVFTRAFKYLKSYNFSNAFSTWLFRIATNKSIDYLRKKQNSPVIDSAQYNYMEEAIRKVYTEDLDPEELLIEKHDEERVRERIRRLNPYSRKIIELRYFDHLSYEGIAKELNVGIVTVKSQLHRAKYLLRNILQTNDEQGIKLNFD